MNEPRDIPTVPYEPAPAWQMGVDDRKRTKKQREHDAEVQREIEQKLDEESAE